MSTMNAAWKFPELGTFEGLIKFVVWEVTWTSPDFPDTEIVSGGDILLDTNAYPIESETSTIQQISQAVTDSLGNQWNHIQTFAEERLEYEYLQNQTIEVDPETMEPPITSEKVNKERDRRIQAGFIYNGKVFDNDPISKSRIIGGAALAIAALMNAMINQTPIEHGNYYWDNGFEPFGWIVQDNTVMPLDVYQMIELGQVAAAWEKRHIDAAYALKNMSPIPRDYKDDMYWL